MSIWRGMRLHCASSAAPFAAVLAVLALVLVHTPCPFVGFFVRIAKTRPCGPGEDDVARVVVQVLRPGVIKINNEDVRPEDLGRRLEEIFRTRVYRYVLLVGEPTLRFGDVVEIIDRAAKQVDHLIIVTPAVVDHMQRRNEGVCIDENLPSDYIQHPPR